MDFDIKDLLEAQRLRDDVKQHIFSGHVDGQITMAEVPDDKKLQDITGALELALPKPHRRKGKASHQTLESFMSHAIRFKNKESALFGIINSVDDVSLKCIFDYHPAGEDHTQAAHREHTSIFSFPFSEEWKLWNKGNRVNMEQIEFAAFIEDHINDVACMEKEDLKLLETTYPEMHKALQHLDGQLATPSRLVELSRGLAVFEGAKVKSHHNLQSGEANIVFETEHMDIEGKPINIPSFFMLEIPVIEGSGTELVLVRLRYRVRGGGISWFYQLYNPDRVVRRSVDQDFDLALQTIKLPLFRGEPE